jgi:hypothetical protein
VVAACGSTGPNRLDLTTPGANTGAPLPAETAAPSATAPPDQSGNAAPQATAPPGPDDQVTAAEKRVIKGWSDSLRAGRVDDAAGYFTVPVLVANNSPDGAVLGTLDEVKEFNRTLPCGAKLIRTRRAPEGFAVGIFRLTERKNSPEPCGSGVGETASVAFRIDDGHIRMWLRVVEAGAPDPMATPTPSAVPSPSTNAFGETRIS